MPDRRVCRLTIVAVVLSITACSVSDEREIAFGRENAAQVERQLPLVSDSIVTTYVQALGERIASRTSRASLPWHFAVIDRKELNAFALPGGFIYVNRGLIEHTDRMDELAGALGHEIGHVVRRHSVQQLERGGATRIGIALLCLITSMCDSRTTRVAIDVGGAAWLAHNSRRAEAEADSEAVANTVRAGISPEGIPELFRVLLVARKAQPNLVQTFFASHPLEESRIAQTQRLVDRVDPAIEKTLDRDEAAFQEMKKRLTATRLHPSSLEF
jgi:predicted Zn-dependent protease